MPDWAWTAISVAIVFVVAAIVLRLSHFAVNRLERRLVDEGGAELTEDAQQRARTLAGVARSIISVIVLFTAVLVALGEVGVAVGPLLAAAGIVGIVLGFGAQTLIKDWIGGFFILLERQFDVGDWVEVAKVDGTVEEVNLRSTVLRGLDGARHVVSNGEILLSSNHTRGYSRYLFELPVPYDADIDRAIEVLRGVGEELRLDPTFRDLVTGPIEVLGVDRYGVSSVDVKAYVPTTPGQQWRVGRELRRRLKLALDTAGIHILFPHREIIMRPAPGATDG